MKLIFGNTFLQQAEKYNITIDDLKDWIACHFHSCKLLCSPLPDTKVYKGYYSGTERIIILHRSGKGLIIPIYMGDKHDPIAKNITVEVIKKYIPQRFDTFLYDLQHHNYKIRHI